MRRFGSFWWNFVVGDDWRVAAGLAVALGLTSLLTHEGVNAWWLLPVGDDWRVAVGIVVAFGVTALLATTSFPAWLILPLSVAGVLWQSLLRSARS